MKIKNKRFILRQNKRKVKRKKHQKDLSKFIRRIGGIYTTEWLMYRVKLGVKAWKRADKTIKIGKLIEKYQVKNKNEIKRRVRSVREKTQKDTPK